MWVRIACLLLMLTLAAAQLQGQQHSPEREYLTNAAADEETTLETVWLFLRDLVIPREFRTAYHLRAWISRQQALSPRDREKDLRRLDAIYQHAVYLADGDAREALFALAIATLPYYTFPAQIPLTGLTITVPVSTENREMFEKRMAALPGKLFVDSPSYLDRDKLPHFFGSAWLQLSTGSELVSLFAGEALEFGEAVFKLEGSRDPRDIMINRLGTAFARQLQKAENVLPSDILKSGSSK
ncbi:MAG: hypothetical protein C0600_15560 [Ignavibacteria bacterium]|nr:MAG: hypothetical protein C0600_15560 [Ignavibacteria bacterium]